MYLYHACNRVVFFELYGDHRDLHVLTHSFPTRRSSDLHTTTPDRLMTEGAEKRLKVLSDLDNLGARFQLASYDLDIRGAGNLLGDEQSGHIKEVGYELYQSMLEEAILEAKAGGTLDRPRDFSPPITVDADRTSTRLNSSH